MSIFNRAFVALMACLWCVALAAALLLVWDQARAVAVDTNVLSLNLDLLFETQAEQILATIVVGALALPALLLLTMEMLPQRSAARGSRRDESYTALQARVETMQKRLDDERDLRKDSPRDLEHERRVVREQDEPDTRIAREPALATSAPSDRDRGRDERSRRGWRFLPGRHA